LAFSLKPQSIGSSPISCNIGIYLTVNAFFMVRKANFVAGQAFFTAWKATLLAWQAFFMAWKAFLLASAKGLTTNRTYCDRQLAKR
jgi:hypothetical protein